MPGSGLNGFVGLCNLLFQNAERIMCANPLTAFVTLLTKPQRIDLLANALPLFHAVFNGGAIVDAPVKP